VSGLRRYGTALAIAAAVSAIKAVPQLSIGQEAPFALLGLGVLSAGWLAGAESALVTAVLLTVGAAYLFFPPRGQLSLSSPYAAFQLGLFFLEGVCITAIIAAMNRSRRLQRLTGHRLEALQALTASLAVARSLEEVTTILVVNTAESLAASGALLVLPGEDGARGDRPDGGGDLRVAATHGRLPPSLTGAPEAPGGPDIVERSRVEPGSPIGRAFATGESDWIDDQETYRKRYPAAPPKGTVTQTESKQTDAKQTKAKAETGPFRGLACLPLVAGGRVIGAAAYAFDHPRAFSANERRMVRGYVTQAAQALDRTLVAAREAASRRRLESLADLSMALSSTLTREEVTKVVIDRGRAAMGADICTLYVVRLPAGHGEGGSPAASAVLAGDAAGGGPARDPRVLELIGDRGVAPEVLDRIRHITADSETPIFGTITSGRSTWTESEEEYRTAMPRLANLPSEAPRAKAYWSVPLIAEGRAVGLLGMGFFQARRFSSDERSFVETFTAHCAQALLRAQSLEAERRARRAAERAEASLGTTLRSIGDAVIATDTRGDITFMNLVAERLTGWPADAARGQPLQSVFRIVNEQSRQPVDNPVDKVLQTGLVVGLANDTVLLSREAGREIPIDDSGAPIRNETGEVEGVVLVFRDVTEKKHEESRRALIADAATTLGSSLDTQATLTRLAELFVPRFADWSAIDVVDPRARQPRRLAVMHVDRGKIELAHRLAEQYPEPLEATTGLGQVLRTGRAELYAEITDANLRATARDEQHLQLMRSLDLRSAMVVPLVARGRTLGAISLVQAESGRHYGADDLAFVEDIARRAAIVLDNAQLYASERQARLAADVANRTKDQFLATVSHELRTPLNAILGWARIMSAAGADEARRGRAIEIIERNAVAMTRLIEDLLDVSRIISGKVRLERDRIDVAEVVEAAVDALRPSLEQRVLELELGRDQTGTGTGTGTGAPSWRILGDANRLQQVFWNLLTNAVKFTGRDGRIGVRTRRHDTSVEIEVTDDGQGIGADFLPHVFDPFRQADGTITRAHGGLGLGLAISRHLVEQHGGTIRAESDGIGRGARFTVGLPLVPATHWRPSGADGLPSAPGLGDTGAPVHLRGASALRGLKVLAVDDDPDARQLVRTILESCGSEVRLAANVGEALQAISEQVPDILLSDIGMPGQDGYALIRKVRQLPPVRGGTIPAAALTAYTQSEDRDQVLSAGFSVHLAKPIEPTTLVAVVADLALARARAGSTSE
jgi:PAS domain S-box-containing protein